MRQNKRVEDLLGKELDILLVWHQIPKSEWGDKKKKMAKWIELKDKKPPFFAPWTDADEKKLTEMKKKDIKNLLEVTKKDEIENIFDALK